MASLESSPSPADRSRSIIVTGASTGIGAHCARALKADGWRVFATARKPADLAALEADGIEAFPLDYRDPQSIETLVASVLERTGGRLDALYNNGAYAQAGAVEDLPVEALREQFEANVFGWHDLTRRLIPVMRAQGRGRIVNCSSRSFRPCMKTARAGSPAGSTRPAPSIAPPTRPRCSTSIPGRCRNAAPTRRRSMSPCAMRFCRSIRARTMW